RQEGRIQRTAASPDIREDSFSCTVIRMRFITVTVPATATDQATGSIFLHTRSPRGYCSALLPVGDMNRLTVDCQSRFLHRLGHGRMREHHHAQVFGTGAELHGDGTLLHQFCRARPDHVHTQHTVRLGTGDDLDETGGIVGRHGTPAGGEGEHADIDFDAFGFQLLLVLADPGRFRMGIDDRGDQIVVHLSLVTGNELSYYHALFRGLVGQHQTTHHVTDRINARHRGGAVVVDEDVTTLIQGNAAVGCQQVGGDRTAAHRHDQLVEHHFLIALGIGVANSDFLTLDFGAGYPGTQLDVQTLLGVDLHRFLGQLLVRGDQELVQRLDDGHFSAQTRPYGAELQTDHAGTDHTQALGHGGELQRAGGIDNDLLVNRSRGNLHRTRARGEDDVLRSQHFAAAVGLGNFDLLTGQQLAVAFIYGHTISLEQPGNTAGQVLDDLILAANHRRHVHLHLAGADAVHAEGI